MFFGEGAAAPAGIEEDDKSVSIQTADTEYMETTDSTLGMADDWSLQITFKLLNDTSGIDYLMEIADGFSSPNDVQVKCQTATTEFHVNLFDSIPSSPAMKNLRWDQLAATNTWQTWVLTFNGTTGDVLLAYKDGSVATVSTTTQDNAGSMTDSSRSIRVGTAWNGSNPTESALFHSIAMWGSVLTPDEIAEIYNSGDIGTFDLQADSGDYASSGNLVIWFRLGLDSDDIGKDTVGSLDLMDNANNISAADIVTDSPP